MFKLILKHIGEHKIQTGSIVLLIASGTLLMFALMLYSFGVYDGIELSEQRSGADVLLVPKDAASEVSDSALLFTGVPFHMYISADIVDQARDLFGVKQVTGQFFAQTIPMACCTPDTETRIVGVDFSTDWTLQPLTDTDLSNGLAEDEVLVGSRIATNSDGTVTILNKKYKIADRLEATGSDIDLCILSNIDTVRDMAASYSENDHFWEEYGQPDEIVSAVLIDLDDNLTDNEYKRAIATLQNIGETKLIKRSAAVEQSQESLRVLFGIMLLATVLVSIVALSQLFSRFYSMAWERRAEFAVYRMLGATKRHLASLIGGEALLLSGTGLVLGLLLGLVLYAVGDEYLISGASFPFVEPSPLLMCGLAGVVILVWLLFALLSILAPLRQIGRISPAHIMRQSDIV